MRRVISTGSFGVVCLAVALMCGCGTTEKVVKVRGKLLRNGQPAQVGPPPGKTLPPGETGRARVTFYPVKADNEAIADPRTGGVMVGGGEMTTVEADGTFALGGARGAGIKPGKYRIVITHPDPSSGNDLLKGAFNEVNSKITRDVAEGKDNEIVIDLAKPQG